MTDKLVEKCLLILRGFNLPADTIGKPETHCDFARVNFLNEAIPIIRKAVEEELAQYGIEMTDEGVRVPMHDEWDYLEGRDRKMLLKKPSGKREG